MEAGGKSKSIRAAFVAGFLLVVAALAMAAPLSASSPPTTTVRAVIWPNLVITVSPKSFKAGKVTFVVKNRDTSPHQFSVNGVTWPKIAPHKSASMTVTFKKPSVYSMTLPDYYPAQSTKYVTPIGSLKVTKR